MRLIGFAICMVIATAVAYLMWGPILHFGFSLIPATAENAWVGKLIVMGFVAYFGGVALPFGFVVLGLNILLGFFD